MRLLRTNLPPSDLDMSRWNRVADLLRSNKGGLGDLGGGNHFLDALESYDDGPLHFLIHTGSRNESGHVDAFVEMPDRFDEEFETCGGLGGRQSRCYPRRVGRAFSERWSLFWICLTTPTK